MVAGFFFCSYCSYYVYNYIVCNSIFGLKSPDAKIKQAFITVHLVSFSHSWGPSFPKGAPATPGVSFGFLGCLVVGTGFLVMLLPTLFLCALWVFVSFLSFFFFFFFFFWFFFFFFFCLLSTQRS